MHAKYEAEAGYDLLAKAFMIPEEFGGRRNPAYSGYRGQFFWHINSIDDCSDWDATYCFEGDQLAPGETALVKVWASPNLKKYSKGDFPIGAQFCIREGPRVVAIAVILENRLKDDA